MKYYVLIITALTTLSGSTEQVKINVFPTVTYNQRIDITNKNTGAPTPLITTPITSNQSAPMTPKNTLLTQNPIVSYSLFKKCCFSAALLTTATYFASLGYLIAQSRSLQQDTHWYNWKQEVPLAALRELPKKQIVEALRDSLHKKYDNAAKNIFTLAAILQKEEQALRRVISYCSWIKKYKMSFLFFNQDCVAELAKQKLERLLFIKEMLTKHITFIMENTPIANEGML